MACDCLGKSSPVCPYSPWLPSEVPGRGKLALVTAQGLLVKHPSVWDHIWLQELAWYKISGHLPGTGVRQVILWFEVCTMTITTGCWSSQGAEALQFFYHFRGIVLHLKQVWVEPDVRVSHWESTSGVLTLRRLSLTVWLAFSDGLPIPPTL